MLYAYELFMPACIDAYQIDIHQYPFFVLNLYLTIPDNLIST